MDHDDDVEHLFSWLQTPDLRYREFAGAREITDSVVIVQQQRANNTPVPQDEPVGAPHHNTQLNEEYPQDQFPDQGETRVEVLPEARPTPQPEARAVVREEAKVDVQEEAGVTRRGDTERVVVREEVKVDIREEVRSAGRGPLTITPEPMGAEEAPQPAGNAGLFALGAAGRNAARTGPAEWAGPRPPLIQTPAARQPVPAAPPVSAVAPPAAPPPPAPTAGGGLLGGAYRESGPNGHVAQAGAPEPPSAPLDTAQRDERSLDAVFGRLSGGRSRLPDPRERLRHIPGLGPPAGRSR